MSVKVARVQRSLKIVKQGIDKKWAENANGTLLTQMYTPSASATANAYRVKISDIAEGDNYYQRTGNDIYLKGVQLAYRVEHSHNVSDEYSSSVRFLIVCDRNVTDLTSTAPAVSDILTNPATNNGWMMAQGTSVNQMFGKKRFQILYDKVVSVTADPSTTSSSTFGPNNLAARHRPIWIPIKKKVSFNTASGSALGSNQCYLYIFSNEGNATTGTGPLVNLQMRTFFSG